MKQTNGADNSVTEESSLMQNVSRRNFLQLAGGITGAGLLLASCRKTPPDTTYIGKGDTALLNYLYIVETILTNFYKQANITPYYGLTQSELELLADMRDHQYAHKGLLQRMLGGDAITEIVTDMSPVTFADRTSFLTNSIMLEELAVGAYNGVIRRMSNTNYILQTVKMATVQARHAAYSRALLTTNTFSSSSVVNDFGLDQELSPVTVMATLKPFIQTKLDLINLPA